ncbi:MAG: methionine ABC transporter substrate-binding protein [Clostridioides sp.]|jgi:D-methionine transport system substrate-binding protein|nr:methionine ABC transporter substrate-binding protein [Clostridioides sp.]
MFKKLSKLLVVTLILILGVTGCSSSKQSSNSTDDEKKDTIKIGVAGSFQEYTESLKKDLEDKGYKVEITFFDDSIQPNNALLEDSIDINFYQHKPFLDNFNKENGTDLEMLSPQILSLNFGIYSNKYDSIDKIPDGATIAVATDNTNRDRSLTLLRDLGFITLKEKEKDTDLYNLMHIDKNLKNIKIKEVDLYQLMKSLDDVDATCINSIMLAKAGDDPRRALAFSKDSADFPIGLVVKKENKDKKRVQDVLDVYTTKNSADLQEKLFKGSVSPLFDVK